MENLDDDAPVPTCPPRPLRRPRAGRRASADRQPLHVARTRLIRPVLEEFTRETGVKVNIVFAQNGLEERIAAEGANSPADLLLTVDVSKLVQAVDMGITQPIVSPALDAAVPPALRDARGQWYAATLRARVVYASKDRVAQQAITYEELADPKWKGKICIRDGQNAYNTSLFAAAVTRMGPAKAEEWLKGVRANLAKKPSGGDREVAKDIAAGQCDIGIGNTYYVGLMLNKEPERKPWAEANQGDLSDLPGWRDACEHLGLRAGEERPEQGRGDPARGMAGRRQGAGALRAAEFSSIRSAPASPSTPRWPPSAR